MLLALNSIPLSPSGAPDLADRHRLPSEATQFPFRGGPSLEYHGALGGY